jgi:GT2 family glycosyltransferase
LSLRRWGRNRGFARAVNEGCRLSRGAWFLLLNPDVSLPHGFLDGVLDLADELTKSDPRAGVVGFQLRNSDGSRQLSTGEFPTLRSTLTGLLRPRARRKYRSPRAGARCQVGWATGCCLLIRRACLEDLGGLDEDYFLYYEDVDLCGRARARGCSVWYEPGLWAVHHHPLHSRQVSPLLRLITRHSLLTYGARHWPWWQVRVLAAIVRAEAWARGLRSWWQGDVSKANLCGELRAITADLARDRPDLARRRLRAVLRRYQPPLANSPQTRASRAHALDHHSLA